ncbi:predicted protein [Uncinocarpus reesii 1704]|uniref:Integral membrane protein n=1 Tax=Uncinocarpus reesii (strain UAMH 1704) TaxID=336963 RepID=C4JXM3_UNCRE|nr:uncharacterized protein UREG_06396 [Uncinocarpus reesii 1704]EEP81531.1 predicted protein [Uncinocarpus reesii 1704]
MDRMPRRRMKICDSRVLKPTLRAFALGYLTTTGPRIISFLRILRRKDLSTETKIRYLASILAGSLRWNRFPAFCALLAAGSTLLPLLLNKIVSTAFNLHGCTNQVFPAVKLSRFLRFVAIFTSAWACFRLINSRRRPESKPNSIRNGGFPARKEIEAKTSSLGGSDSLSRATDRSELAGRTLDLTLFAMVRAVDVLACISWSHWKRYRRARKRFTRIESIMPQLSDTGLFAATAALVMWAWFYLPERLPFSYGRWISEAAQIDHRLIEALRSARRGEWTYGRPKSKLVLEPMCEDYGWPRVWGDTSQTVPIPCELVHMGCGPNCEVHAIWRFAKSFKFVLTTDLPIQLLLRSRSPSLQGYLGAVKASLRSSAFLGLFVSIFYYSVCLARTRLGPKIFARDKVTPMMWDSGLCVAAGCMMCGWSIFVESAKKRQEIALFVAPRAIATFLPRRYERKYLWREQLVFSLSTAVVLSCVQSDPKKIRGVLGRILGQVFGKT